MFLYVDESSDEMHYVLAAVGSRHPDVFRTIVKTFREKVRHSGLSDKDKSKINNDPKERMLHRYYGRLLSEYVDLIAVNRDKRHTSPLRSNVHLYGAYYQKIGPEKVSFAEERMFVVYEALLLQTIEKFVDFSGGENIEIICDHFMKAEMIVQRLNQVIPLKFPALAYTLNYAAGGERGDHMGLFVADVVAGTIRRFLRRDQLTHFHRLKDMFIGDIGGVIV